MLTKYKVAKYIRLSLADGDNRESESVENQRDLLNNYLNQRDEFSEIYEYVDDGYSGGNFDRPDFKRLLNDIRDGKINCVITKDLSRFGREHIETGYYLEKYFPMINLRYIALNDGVDTIDSSGLQYLQFKLSFNDYYIVDQSNKIKSVKKKKMMLGEQTGGIAPYGYQRDPKIKNHLIVDEVVAPIIKEIFEMYGYKEMTAREIATELTNRNVLVPSAYKRMGVNRSAKDTVWQRVMVLHILKNMTYIGCVVGGKLERISPKIRKCRRTAKENYVITENMHEPIVDKVLWDLVQAKIKKLTQSTEKKNEYTLKGLVFCGECGARGNFQHRKKCVDNKIKWEYTQVICNRRVKGCSNKIINERELLNAVNLAIKNEVSKIKYTNKALKELLEKIQQKNNKNEEETNVKKLELKLQNISNSINMLYNNKLEKKITVEVFKSEYERLNNEKALCEQKIEKAKETKEDIEKKLQKNNELIKIAKKYLKMESPDNETIKALVKRVIYKENEITVELNFENAF